MNLDALIQNAPSTSKENMGNFTEWLYQVKKIAEKYNYSELLKIEKDAEFFINSEIRRNEYKAKILPRLKDLRGDLNYMNSHPAIFIVHGHDDALKSDIARTIEKLGFEAVILHEQANKGKTIIEKLESEIGRVKFGIVLYTADDNGENGKMRARQNVVFEHGFLIGRLGRERVCVIMDDNVEKPSDSDGLVYIPRANWKYALVDELKAAGLDVDKNLI